MSIYRTNGRRPDDDDRGLGFLAGLGFGLPIGIVVAMSGPYLLLGAIIPIGLAVAGAVWPRPMNETWRIIRYGLHG